MRYRFAALAQCGGVTLAQIGRGEQRAREPPADYIPRRGGWHHPRGEVASEGGTSMKEISDRKPDPRRNDCAVACRRAAFRGRGHRKILQRHRRGASKDLKVLG